METSANIEKTSSECQEFSVVYYFLIWLRNEFSSFFVLRQIYSWLLYLLEKIDPEISSDSSPTGIERNILCNGNTKDQSRISWSNDRFDFENRRRIEIYFEEHKDILFIDFVTSLHRNKTRKVFFLLQISKEKGWISKLNLL